MNTRQALAQLDTAAQSGKLSASAVENIRKWLTDPSYASYVADIVAHMAAEKWQQLDDVFWTVIPFGTGGRRGRMYPIGSNAINDRTIGESAQGLADYVHCGTAQSGTARRAVNEPATDSNTTSNNSSESSNAAERRATQLSCAIAYDTRHRSRHFAELCAGIMVANGFRVYFLDGYRSTPELSFLVRHRQCDCGIMVTASHNPPSDNAVKVYWSTGGQVLPPHDQGIIERVMNVGVIRCADFQQSVDAGQIELCGPEIDEAFFTAVCEQGFGGPRDLKILYSPLHGVGGSAVCPVLAKAGFQQVELYGPQAEPDGDFPNVPGHVSNPENPRIFDALIAHARSTGADVALATDPDCDRLGCAAPLSLQPDTEWDTLTGNQLGVLLSDYVLEQRRRAGTLTPDHYLVKTLVTTEMIRRVAESYGVCTCGDLLVGFKWIGGVMDLEGPDKFLLGSEESHGYLVGQYARDKDAAVACLLLAELAAQLKSRGKTLHEKLDDLYWQHGCHQERLITFQMEGSEGMAQMQRLMARFRQEPPARMGGLSVAAVRDYLAQTVTSQGRAQPLGGPRGDLVILDLEQKGNAVAVRPSGTEPKAKFYLFACTPAEQLSDLSRDKQQLTDRLDRLEQDIREYCAR